MTCSIKLSGVSLHYPIYSVRAQSLRSTVLNLAVGGRLYRSQGDVAVVRALEGINLDLREGDRLGLVGHNGSGKTTLLKVIAGVYEPEHGYISIQGQVTSMIALGAGLDLEVSGLQNILKIGAMRLLPRKVVEARIPAIVEFSGLGDFVKLPMKTYSAGMIARLMFSCATEFDADIVVLDEWLSAGDADFIVRASERMNKFVERAKIVVLGTHDANLVRTVCNKVCELHHGKIAFYGATEDWVQWRETAGAA